MFRLCVFDVDQTLVDSTRCITNAVQHSFRLLGLPCPEEDIIRQQIGLPLDDALSNLTRYADAPINSLRREFRNYFGKNWRRETTLYPGVRQTIMELRSAHYALAICTSKHTRSTIELLEWFKIKGFFKVVIGVDATPRPKPYPDGLHIIMDVFNVPPSKAVMIGDHPIDMKMAGQAGTYSIGVRTGGFKDEELRSQCKNMLAILDSVAELTPPLLERLYFRHK
ncbi:MAG: HAD family hydrolase [Candidatus Ranarchaeia archaeon]